MMNLLLTGAFSYSSEQMVKLSALGYNVVFMRQETDVLPLPANEVDVTVCNGLFLAHDIDEFVRLRFIQLTSAGFERVPMERIRERGIILKNARGVYSIPMAEWALMRVLEKFKNSVHFATAQANRGWLKCRSLMEIFDTKVAVIGAGNVGQEVAKRFRACGAEITGFDIHTNNTPYFDEMKHISSFADQVGEYNIVVVTAPLTDETFHLISGDVLREMKTDAMLVNIARGALVDEKALTVVLEERSDLTVALDVFEEEPLPVDSELWQMKNVMVSPHNSFVGNGNNARMFRVMYDNLTDFINREK